MNLKNVVGALVVLGAVIVTGQTAFAAIQAQGNLNVTATVISTCTIGEDAPVAFGSYDPVGAHAAANLDAAGALTVTCTNGTTYDIGLDPGANFTTTRRMSDGAGGFLAYGLFQDAARSTPWTDAAGGMMAMTAADNQPVIVPVYGRIPSGQDIPVGTYSDVVLATVNF